MVRGQPATGPRAASNATTAEVASKPRCIVSNCWASAWPRGTLIVRSRSSRSGSFAGSLEPMAFARSFLNGFTALGIPVTEVVG